jgi:predicted TIM-barrel fold metal-dependent hydrolase
MQLSDFRPVPALVTKVTRVERPRFPVIDAHNHLGEAFGGNWVSRPLSELLDELDASGVRCLIDLDGGWGEAILQDHLERFKAKAPDRFAMYAGVDWSAWPDHGDRFGEWAAQRLVAQKAWGAQGLKIWKTLGLRVHDPAGKLVDVDDPRLDPIWAAAGELDLPITIHVADPVAFFWPVDGYNERWEELQAFPDWQFTSPPFPPFLHILEGLARVVERHPETTFVGAHVGCYAENLAWVGQLLDRCPNFNVDISARIAELGRQPYSSRRFFLKYADRILFGMDIAANREEYRVHFRFLETDDEYFPYSTSEVPPQGRWSIYGLDLPEEVLQKVYYRNAARIIFHQAA